MHIVSKPRNRPALARVGTLATLPVFFTLKDRRVLMVGASEATAWKCELLLATGAKVQVLLDGETPCAELNDLAGKFPDRCTLDALTDWRMDPLAGYSICVADVNADDAEELVACTHACGIPTNVIDQPDFCDFQFGSIVNRSPFVIGISTSGAAPIIGQIIRQKIETLLPSGLGAWGQAAQAVRNKTMHLLRPGAERRAFWESFGRAAFAVDATDNPLNMVDKLLDEVRTNKASRSGKVTLVGAGPGNAELLTLKAVRALQAADVILFDDLVSAEVLELARREAKRMLVGKRGGRPSCSQEEINEMMVRFAKAGKNIVRLKSGDPLVFGRAGEEIAMLQAMDIPVDIVPGITSGFALAAKLGVSLTHRDHGQALHFITGHARNGELPENVAWASLTKGRDTALFYMCRRTLPLIVERLRGSGMSGQIPAVIAANLDRTDEHIWQGNLGAAPEALGGFGLEDVMLFAVGEALAERSRWGMPRNTHSAYELAGIG